MTTDEQERMQILCERIAKEQDQDEFVKLVQELNALLDNESGPLSHPTTIHPATNHPATQNNRATQGRTTQGRATRGSQGVSQSTE
jgi:hypothetical protein